MSGNLLAWTVLSDLFHLKTTWVKQSNVLRHHFLQKRVA